MSRVLGIDPGSRATGFGVIDGDGTALKYVTSGVIRTGSAEFPDRLRIIFEGISEVISNEAPTAIVVEQVFVQHNVASALKLGQARGAAICAGATRGIPISEYAPRAIKLALTGSGAADKGQVQQMVLQLLGLNGKLQEDAGDALAVALCHLQQARLGHQLDHALASQRRRRR
ncbi:MAG: crossover junction endodeoxyribonuclease RuvC [Aquisalimonadaceae bacterium]